MNVTTIEASGFIVVCDEKCGIVYIKSLLQVMEKVLYCSVVITASTSESLCVQFKEESSFSPFYTHHLSYVNTTV